MSFVEDREVRLFNDLESGRISEDEFYRTYPLDPGTGSDAGLAMLVRALHERDDMGVGLGLRFGFNFGFSDAYLDVLLALAEAPWHRSHENLTYPLEELDSPRKIDTFARLATVKLTYVEDDKFKALGTKCLWVLGRIGTREAVLRIGELLRCGEPIIEYRAEEQLKILESESPSEDIRALARKLLAARSAMSFVSEREAELCADLVSGRISQEEFCRAYPIEPRKASEAGHAMLVRGLHERDRRGVEAGIVLVLTFGVSEAYLDVLLELVEDPWHRSHEKVVSALAELHSPRIVEPLGRTGWVWYPYLDDEEPGALASRCIGVLGKMRTREAVLQLEDLTRLASVGSEAEEQLKHIESESPSEDIRALARELLKARSERARP